MDPLEALRHNRELEAQAKRLRLERANQRQLLIKKAFDLGHTGDQIGAAAGCSKQRAYQLRDQD